MYTVMFDYYFSDDEKYSVIATCKTVNNYDVIGLKFKFVDDQDITVRVSYDPELFEDIEQTAVEMLIDDYYNRPLIGAQH